MDNMEFVYLKGLAKQFPTIASASTEIINLEATLNLPKGTEHFSGSSQEESAVNAEKPAIPMGVTLPSVPPASITSASPY